MIIEKAKTYFAKYPELKVLFFFDPEKEYQTEIEQNSDSDFKITAMEISRVDQLDSFLSGCEVNY